MQNYSPNTVGEADLTLTFNYNNPTYTAIPTGAGPRLEAVVYGWDFANSRCLYSSPLAKTTGAHIAIGAVPGSPPITILSQPITVGPNPVVSLDTPFANFGLPFYQSAGSTGYLNICIELQVFVCDVKLDFVDVHVKVGFNLKEDCENDCLDVTEIRAQPINVDIGTLDLISIHCEPCTGADAVIITQGTTVNACLSIVGIANIPGACIVSIENFDFVLGTKTYDIVPTLG